MKAVGGAAQKKSSRVLGGGRKRKAGVTPPTTVELRGIQVHFPFKPYKCQEDYMGKVLDALLRSENALLESPTGTGKTLCLLCATLAWQREQAKLVAAAAADNNTNASTATAATATAGNNNSSSNNSNSNNNKAAKRVPTIIYASRTHSQLSQVVRELRNTRYRPKHAVLASREQMCVHPKVKKETATSSDVNHDCNALSKERKCRYRNQLEGFTAPNHSYEENVQSVLDMEDLVLMGKEHKVCPFYYTRSLLPDAELVLMPYNYLFDKDTRENTLQDIVWSDCVLIFDEAHNLESFATDSASFDLSQTDLAMCVAELNRALNYMTIMGDEDSHALKKDNVTRLKALFLHFEDFISGLNRSGAFSGEYMMEIFTKGMSINHANYILFIDEVRKVSDLLLDARGGGGGSTSKGAPKLEHFTQCIKRVFGEQTESRCMAKAKSYRVHISPQAAASNQKQQGSKGGGRNNNNSASRTLSYWCFSPSLAMQELSSLKIRSIIVTSGTLSPLPSYSMELGIPFPHTLENPHIVTNEQIHVRVIGKGVSGKVLTSSFQRRKDGEYYIELGNTLVSLAKVVPAGMLVFFPSYSVMETCLERWGGPASSASRYNNANKGNAKTSSFFAARNRKGNKASNRQQYSFPFTAPSIYGSALGGGANPITPWKRLIGAKAVVVEPRSTTDLTDAISEFHKYLGMPKSKGCILMGVCRGKISEGIDFADNMARAVIITGLPFPPAFNPKVKLKREYLDGTRASRSVTSKEAGGFGGPSTTTATVSGKDEKAAAASEKPNVLSGHEWYSQQAHRAVNQAIGRVIRNRNDYGAILLLDSRYAQPANQQGLSKWVRPHLLPDEGVGPAIGSLAKFYRRAEARAREQEQATMGVVLEYEEDAKNPEQKRQRQPQQNTEDAFTKVAIVRNLTRGLKTSNPSLQSTSFDAPEAPGGDAEEALSYIAPERVLARLNVDTMVKKKESVFLGILKRDTAQGPASRGRESVFGARTQGMTKKPNKASSSLGTNRKVDTKKTAAEFFKKAEKMLSSEEFSTIRKSSVAMKKHGDKKDRKSYLVAAGEVLSLCIERDQYFGPYEKEHNGTLLFLFFTLLPPVYRPPVEQMAMKSLFMSSLLGQLCKENLPQEQYTQLLKGIPIFLQTGWCHENDSSGGPSSNRTDFLREAQKMLVLLREENKPVSSVVTSAFMKLVPSRFVSATQALLTEMEASRKIQRMKAAEARNKGEEAIDPIRFRRAPTSQTMSGSASATVKAEPLNAATQSKAHAAIKCRSQGNGLVDAVSRPASNPSMSGPPMIAKGGTATSKPPPTSLPRRQAMSSISGTVNPYAKKAKSLSSYIGQVKAQGPTNAFPPVQATKPSMKSNRAAPAYARTSELSKTGKPSSSERDPVARMLHQAQSQPFVRKKTAGDIVRGIKSNVPSNVCCVVCSKTAERPMLGDCNHMACQGCWLQWLKRSETCPICRVSVKAKSLARVVFQNQESNEDYGGGSVTLSQLCD